MLLNLILIPNWDIWGYILPETLVHFSICRNPCLKGFICYVVKQNNLNMELYRQSGNKILQGTVLYP